MTTYYKRHQWVFDVLLVAAFLLWCAPSDAQDLPAVAASGGGYWPLIIIAIIGAGVAGFVIWHKRNPSKADAAVQTAVTDAQTALANIATKATEAVHGLQETVAKQAAVIASPPVQAVINAQPAPPAPTPEVTAMATCSQEQRELVCRAIAFGHTSPYAKKLYSPEYAPQLIGGNPETTKNAYAPGGQCNAGDGGYYLSHTVPPGFDWHYRGGTYVNDGPPDPMGMVWNNATQRFE